MFAFLKKLVNRGMRILRHSLDKAGQQSSPRQVSRAASISLETLEDRLAMTANLMGHTFVMSAPPGSLASTYSITIANQTPTPQLDGASTITGATGNAFGISGTITDPLQSGTTEHFFGYLVDQGNGMMHVQLTGIYYSQYAQNVTDPSRFLQPYVQYGSHVGSFSGTVIQENLPAGATPEFFAYGNASFDDIYTTYYANGTSTQTPDKPVEGFSMGLGN